MLEFTGERMVPEASGLHSFWEHIYRYRFAAQFVRGKRVLDIACGEGYGTAALMKAGAPQVIGIDISAEACRHAKVKYGVDARLGDADNIPLADGAVDCVVSFETIEHVSDPQAFLQECARVLTPNGRLILSTPAREVYRRTGRDSSFHVSELGLEELVSLLLPLYSRIRLYTQQPTSISWWSTRPLALLSAAWLKVPGCSLLRQIIVRAACPHVLADPGNEGRNSAVRLILAKDGALSCLVNPYSVRRQIPWTHEEPVYVVVVARTRCGS